MALTEQRKKTLLAYCRINEETLDEAEEALLEQLYSAAQSYLAQAGIEEPEEGTARAAQYELLAQALVLDAYDRRDMSFTGMAAVAENPMFRRMLVQLKLTESVSDSDTDTSEED